jgi:hydrogenase-4 component D
MDLLILLLILLPVLGSVSVALGSDKSANPKAMLATSLTLIVFVIVSLSVNWSDSSTATLLSWEWLKPVGAHLDLGYLLDPLAGLLLVIVVLLGSLVIWYSTTYVGTGNKEHPSETGRARHHGWLLLFIAAMIGVAISPNLLQLYMFWEMTTLCSWALISHYRNSESLAAGYKALLMTFSGGLFFALGLVLLFVHTKSFSFDALSAVPENVRYWIFGCFMVAAWAKSAQIPFYTWLPDAMAAPTTVSMYLHAAAMVKAGVFLMARLCLANNGAPHMPGLLLALMATATMLVALYFFFHQIDLKRLLAYSTIAHLAYILFGFGLGLMGSRLGWYAGAMHIMNHSVGKGLLFLTVGSIAYSTGTRRTDELSGLAQTSPWTAAAFFVGMLAILGVPPFSGFFSKFYLLLAAIQLGGVAGYLMVVPFLLEIVIAFAWFFHIGHKVFLGPVSPAAQAAAPLPLSMRVILAVLMALTILAPWLAFRFMQILGM